MNTKTETMYVDVVNVKNTFMDTKDDHYVKNVVLKCGITKTALRLRKQTGGKKMHIKIKKYSGSTNKICDNCRWSYWQHYRSGKRNWCSKESHKITKGKTKCNNFEWD